MPKRTNFFQKLIFAIHQQLAGEATVTESNMLVDRATGLKREVDITIETVSSGVPITIGIEVVDLRRPADVEWVNKMSGKHKNLPTDRLVLVSRNGFTAAATREAQSCGFDAMTFGEALDVEWTKVVKKLRELYFGRSTFTATEVRALIVDGEPNAQPPIVGPNLILYDRHDRQVGPLGSVLYQAVEEANILKFLYDHPDGKDIRNLTLTINLPEDCYAYDDSGTKRTIEKLQVAGKCSFEIRPVTLEHGRYGSNQIAFGEVPSPEGHVLVTVIEREGEDMVCKITILDKKQANDSQC